MQERAHRKLASIVAADVAGYSRLMARDEAGTIDAVRALKTELIEPVVTQHGGRVVKTMGDGFLMEFASVVDSVEAAVDIQTRLSTDSADLPEDSRVTLRVGIHIGDIVVENDDIFGEGVIVAARIEPLISPGGIGISDEAYQQVRDKLGIEWVDGGVHEVKNIARPLRVWQWSEGPLLRPKEPELEVPDIPSVAVLPFDNMSSDEEQEHFADGLTEDLTTDLSKISGLFVVARNSTFAFKGQAVDIPTIGRRLGVANVVEGSVRKMGGRVRINVQLINAATGGHIWAERYDGSIDSVFELQDDVCREVVSALSVTLTKSEARRMTEIHTTNVDAYELFVQAKSTPFPPIPARIAAARDLFEQVTHADPGFAGGYAGLSWMLSFGALWGHDDPTVLGARAEALAHKAISVDESFGWTYTVLALALLAQRRFDEAVAASKRGLELLPNDADAHVFYAVIMSMRGHYNEATDAADTAFRLSPNFVNGPYLNVRCHTNFMAGNYREAIEAFETNMARGGPLGPPAYCWAVACYRATGQTAAAQKLLDEFKSGFPQFRLATWNFLKLVENDTRREQVTAQFRDAGIPM